MSSRIGPSPTETMTELICLRCPAIINGLLGNKKAILACNLTTWFDYLRGILEANALTDWVLPTRDPVVRTNNFHHNLGRDLVPFIQPSSFYPSYLIFLLILGIVLLCLF